LVSLNADAVDQAMPPLIPEEYPAADLTRFSRRCLVTVGTTNFNALIARLDANADRVVEILKQNKFDCLTIQIGRGTVLVHRKPHTTRHLVSLAFFVYIYKHMWWYC
jgi:hypothetical protein